jgi:hypothetical protein
MTTTPLYGSSRQRTIARHRKAWLDQLIEAGRLALRRSPEFVRLRGSLGEGAAEI